MALHESRSREAVRIVARYRHLIHDDAGRPGGGGVQETKPMSVQQPRRPATISPILLAAIIVFFVVAHGIGLRKMHAFDGADRAAPGATLTRGD
jgi:hypothetical protein